MTDALKDLLGIPKIKVINEPTKVARLYIYTQEYKESYIRGREGDWEKPKALCHRSIWGWVIGLRDGEHV